MNVGTQSFKRTIRGKSPYDNSKFNIKDLYEKNYIFDSEVHNTKCPHFVVYNIINRSTLLVYYSAVS